MLGLSSTRKYEPRGSEDLEKVLYIMAILVYYGHLFYCRVNARLIHFCAKILRNIWQMSPNT
jgi:hypothetical protein